MDRKTPWTTCFLTRMLILYLERIGKEEGLDYHEILYGEKESGGIGDPKAFLKDYNNWVPHAVLKNLIQAAEKVSGSKEITYLAAKNYFRADDGPSLLEIIAKLQNNIEQALYCSNLWATGFANYFKLQCLVPDAPGRSEVALLSEFGPDVEPIVGNFQFIRGNYEGFARLFDYIESARCVEEISQLKIENLTREFGDYHIQEREDRLSIIENVSKREIVSARKVYLQTEALPFSSDDPVSAEGAILFPQDGKLRVITPRIDDHPKNGNKENQAYEIIREGTLRAGPLAFTLEKGRLFNAPYSRYRFTWKSKKSPKESPEIAQTRSKMIPLLFNHIRELRETHRQLLRRAVENRALAQANEALRNAIQKEDAFFGIIGKSPKMRALFEQVELIGQADSTILIVGETGTGKELLAKAIHQSSPRRGRRFYAINCAALTESLLESELFGYEKGAFTGAFSQKKGIFETAHGGTLFLDEIGELSPTLQAKLLRVLEEREIRRVGGRETIPIDVRIISATHQDLKERVAAGKFRSDLFYRLHVISLVIPPLRERLEDLLLLVDHFLNLFSQKCRKERPDIDREAIALLTDYPWPGNIRQLKNVMERAVVLDRDHVIRADDILLPEEALPKRMEENPQIFHEALVQYKRSLIEEALRKSGGNRTRAAELLGLQRTYLARLMRLLKIQSQRPSGAGVERY